MVIKKYLFILSFLSLVIAQDKWYQVHAGRAGYYVYTPFRLEDSEDIILVNRGWVSTNNDRNLSPRLIMTKGMISINGVIKEEPRTGLLLTKEHVEKLSETITRVQ